MTEHGADAEMLARAMLELDRHTMTSFKEITRTCYPGTRKTECHRREGGKGPRMRGRTRQVGEAFGTAVGDEFVLTCQAISIQPSGVSSGQRSTESDMSGSATR